MMLFFKRFYKLSRHNSCQYFDRKVKREKRDFAARDKNWDMYEFLKIKAAEIITDRLSILKQKSFNLALDYGAGNGTASHIISRDIDIKNIDIAEYSRNMVKNAMNRNYRSKMNYIIADEEFYPFDKEIYDLIFSCLSLHWVNDLNTLFKNIRNSLKNDGVFLFAMLGGSTASEYVNSVYGSNQDKNINIPFVPPYINPGSIADLLHSSGFVMITVDTVLVKTKFRNLKTFLNFLEKMSETHCPLTSSTVPSTEFLDAVQDYYIKNYSSDGINIDITFEIIFGIGWKSNYSKDQKEIKQ